VLRDKAGLRVGYLIRPSDTYKVDLVIFDADGNVLVRIESKNYRTSDHRRQSAANVAKVNASTETIDATVASTSSTPAVAQAYIATSGGVNSNEALNILIRHHKDWAPLTIALVSRLSDLRKDLPVEYLEDTHVFHLTVNDSRGTVDLALWSDETVKLKPRVLIFVECDEERIKCQLYQDEVIRHSFKMQPPRQ
jgi:hypothetical protein